MVVKIIESLREEFERKINNFGRTCAKYDIPFDYSMQDEPEIWYTRYGCDMYGEPYRDFYRADEVERIKEERRRGAYLEPVRVYVYDLAEAELLKKGDYSVLGKIEILSAGNIITAFSDEYTINPRFRHTDGKCEHCGTLRNRNNLFVIRNNETGEEFQVGSSCLRFYSFGRTSEAIQRYYEQLCKIILLGEYGKKYIRDDDCFFGRWRTMYDPFDIIKYSLGLTRILGYKKADSMIPTKDLVKIIMDCHLGGGYGAREIEIKINDLYNNDVITAEQLRDFEKIPDEEVQQIIDYFINEYESTENASDFLHNAYTLIKSRCVEAGKIGFLACLPYCYDRAVSHNKEKAIKAEKEAQSEHFGEIKKRYTVSAKEIANIELVAKWDVEYGYSTDIICLFKIVYKNHILIWKTKNYIDMQDVENNDKFVFTVKEHGDFRGTKQTVITRCTFK